MFKGICERCENEFEFGVIFASEDVKESTVPVQRYCPDCIVESMK